MSNTLAIAAVTATLRDLLNKAADPLPIDPDPDPDLADATCSTKPLNFARKDESTNQLNLFLYQTSWNAGYRNNDVPSQVRSGETQMPPVALSLYYVVTAYGKGEDDVLAHRLLGRAMSLLNDRAVLLPDDVSKALKGNDLGKQVERVRIIPHAISCEELSKLWAVFQTPYRISATYEVAVVLIDSSRHARAPLPVLTRGARVVASLIAPFPELTGVTFPLDHQPAARLPSPAPPAALPGDTVSFAGHDLAGTAVTAMFSHALFSSPVEQPPTGTPTAGGFQIAMPADQTILPAGVYAVSARVSRSPDPKQDLFSNAIPMAIAPRLRTIAPGVRDADGNLPLTVLVSPEVWPAQRASVILGTSENVAAPRTVKTDTLQFLCRGLAGGTYSVRVRIDGVDSFLIDYAAPALAFDPSQSVVIPP